MNAPDSNPLMGSNSQEDTKEKEANHILSKFLKRGYDALNEEELAITVANPEFTGIFKKKTGMQRMANNEASIGSISTRLGL